jgi:hypothetical protein
MMAENKPNLLVLMDICIKGVPVGAGSVIAKSALAEADWQTLCNMRPARLQEVADKPAPSVMPGAK